MSAPQSPAARAAALRVLDGERKASVAKATGVSRSTIDRHLVWLLAEKRQEAAEVLIAASPDQV